MISQSKGAEIRDWRRNPKLFREHVRRGEWRGSTSGICPEFVQANLVLVPRAVAFDFLLFCTRNQKACPLLEVTEPGLPILKEIAPGADLRTDLPAYLLYENGRLVDELVDVKSLWADDLVGFLLGCSYTFDAALYRAGLPVPHFLENREPGIYTTNVPCKQAGIFFGPLVVSARAVPSEKVVSAVLTTARFKRAHGPPVHIGDPSQIGINDLEKSEYGGEGIKLKADEVAVFWACGITPQAVAVHAKVPFMITHKPGHMFISDLPIEALVNE